jgi:hypothetical protein
LNDRPSGLDAVLAREERAISCHGVAQEPLVGAHLLSVRVVNNLEFGRIAAAPD